MYGNLIKGIQSSGDDLHGFEIDVYQWLHNCKYFSNIEVETTSDVECLINASLTYQGDIDEAWIAQELCRIWEECLRYKLFEIHDINNQEGVITLNFCTKSKQLGVTGRIIANP